MVAKRLKSLLVAAFSLGMVFFSNPLFARDGGHGEAPTEKKEGFNPGKVIFNHVLDAHEFHFFSYTGSDGKEHHVSIPLPVILYSPQKGWSVFMSSAFHHGEHEVDGYKLVDGKIVPVDPNVKVLDLSLTRNVVQMIIALALFVWIMLKIAARYKRKEGVQTAPNGVQGFFEPIITFIRDEVAKPNLGHKADKYLPYLLTVFFFILVNNIFGLIPGVANVTGNIAFTAVLGLISGLVIVFSGNKHYWGHIFNPPGVPTAVKFILVPVEFLGIFIKPFALIIRLFANMLAGHIIIVCLISLIFIFGQMSRVAGVAALPVSVGFTIFIYLIEVLVAFLQAYIFTMLTAVFIGQAVEEAHHEPHEAHATAEYDDQVIV